MTQMSTAVLPKRNEIEEKYTYDLANIYADEAAWRADYKQLEGLLPSLEEFKGHLGDSAQKMAGWFKAYEEAYIISGHLFVWTGLNFDVDTNNQAAGALRESARAIQARFQTTVAFADPELLAIPKERIEQFMHEEPSLQTYAHYF